MPTLIDLRCPHCQSDHINSLETPAVIKCACRRCGTYFTVPPHVPVMCPADEATLLIAVAVRAYREFRGPLAQAGASTDESHSDCRQCGTHGEATSVVKGYGQRVSTYRCPECGHQWAHTETLKDFDPAKAVLPPTIA